MANSSLNSALHHISGAIDRWVYRQFRGKTVISRRPEGGQEPTPAQAIVRERFRLAADYATQTAADPVLSAPYEAKAFHLKVPPREVMVADYLRSPVVKSVNLAGFHGAVGDAIAITAEDDMEVISVHVAIRAADESVLEQGPAVLQGNTWVYLATTARGLGETGSIVVTATDRPNHTGALTVPWSI